MDRFAYVGIGVGSGHEPGSSTGGPHVLALPRVQKAAPFVDVASRLRPVIHYRRLAGERRVECGTETLDQQWNAHPACFVATWEVVRPPIRMLIPSRRVLDRKSGITLTSARLLLQKAM